MGVREILKEQGVEENLDKIVSAINDQYMLKSEIHEKFVSKAQYGKKMKQLDDLQEKYDDLEAKGNNDGWEEKYNQAVKELSDYKQNIETEKVNADKNKALVEALKATGFTDNIVKLMQKQFDLSKLELEEGKIKDWDNLVEPFKEEYAGFISKEVEEGQGSAKPPFDSKQPTQNDALADALGKYL